MDTGDIYCFNLESKELQLIQKSNALNLYIDSYDVINDDFQKEDFLLDLDSIVDYSIDDFETETLDFNIRNLYNERKKYIG